MASSPQPDFIQEALPEALLFLLPPGVPCPQGQEAWPIHFVDFLHGLFYQQPMEPASFFCWHISLPLVAGNSGEMAE